MPASGRAAYLAAPNHNSSCAASFSNIGNKKRTPMIGLCSVCQQPINRESATRKRLCASCGQAHHQRLLNRPKRLCTYKDINNHARDVMRFLPKICLICGYSKHADVCHIRAIGSFPGEATCGEINQQSNLVRLCPTHHWEFDHGVLAREEGERKREEGV